MIRPLTLLGLLALAALIPAAGGASSSRVAVNSVTFTDSTGEDPNGPDITSVVVSNDDTGLISFQINVPNQNSLTGDKLYDIDIDADNNPATGDPDPLDPGADYAIERFQGIANLFQWDGKTFSRSASGPSQATLVYTNAQTGPIIKISNVEVGNTKQFKFNVLAVSNITSDASGNPDFTKAHVDFAPDLGHGFWSYQVKTAPLRLLATKFREVPSRPKAGRLFSVRMVAVRSDTGAALQGGAVTCTARIGGKPLTVRLHRIANKEAQCAWLIPAPARGKTVRGSIVVTFEGLRVTKTFSAVIR